MGSIFWRRVLSAHLGVLFLGGGQTGLWAHPHRTPAPKPPSASHRFRVYLTPACPAGREERQPHSFQDEMGH